jgi:hypothetical protein
MMPDDFRGILGPEPRGRESRRRKREGLVERVNKPQETRLGGFNEFT